MSRPALSLWSGRPSFRGRISAYLQSPARASSLFAGEHVPMRNVLLIGMLVRLAVVIASSLLDKIFHVRYTDVDYHVFSDASWFLAKRQSPFERATYRYSPLLAVLLLVNVYLHESAGKLMFAAADIVLGYLIYLIHLKRGVSSQEATKWAELWVYNPLAINISTRGSSDALTSLMILAVLHMLLQGKVVPGALLFGLCVHFRVYPVIYSLSFFLHIALSNKTEKSEPWYIAALTSPAAWKFTVLSIISFVLFTLLSYIFCGKYFLQEALLYHFTRTDHRHNFSPHFYWILLNEHRPLLTLMCGVCAFIPQASVLVLCAIRHASTDLPFCLLIQTMTFVTFNKVCTAQYFAWYTALLPVALTHVHFTRNDVALSVGMWVSSLTFWLLQAYRLEFTSIGDVHTVWQASLAFMTANFAVIYLLLRRHKLTLLDSELQRKIK